MRTPLAIALGASLIGNVALALYAVRANAPQTPPESPATRESAAAAAPAGNTPSGIATSTAGANPSGAPLSTRDPKNLIDTLRGAGFSPAMLRSIAYQLAREHVSQDPSEIAPYWKREGFDPANREARAALEKRRTEFVENLVGKPSPSSELNPGQRQRQFGSLSDEKIDAISRIERDYGEVRQAASAAQSGRAMGVDRIQDMMREQELVEQEKRADLAAVLTPEELEQYEMRNSRTASTVMSAARMIDMTEEEYTALYRSQKAFDDANPRQMGPTAFSPQSMQQRIAAQDALNEKARQILGDERFYSYLEASDGTYASMARFAEQEKIARSATYEAYKIQREMQNSMAQLAQSGSNASPAERIAEGRAMMQQYSSRLETVLGPAGFEAYKKQGFGRMLNAMNSLPAGASPAVRLPGGN